MSNTRHTRSLLFPILLVLYEISTYLSNDMYLPALPEMMNDLNLSASAAQLTLTTWFIGSAIAPLFMGVISDRFGRRIVLLTGGAMYVISTIFCAIAPTAQLLLLARLIEGGMIASMLVAGYASIHESYDTKEAVKILALMGSISVLAPALGPLCGGILLLSFSWRGIFWVIAVFAFILLILLNRFMPETLPPEKRQPIYFKSVLQSYLSVLKNPRYLLSMLTLGLIFSAFLNWVTSGPLLVIQTFKFSAIAFGLMQTIIFSAFIAGNTLIKFVIEKLSLINLICIGMSIALCGIIFMLIFAIYLPTSLLAFLITLTIFSFGSGLAFSPLNRLTIESSAEPMGARVAMFTVFLQGFAALGSGLASFYFTGTIISLVSLMTYAMIAAYLLFLLLLNQANSKI